MAASDRHLDLGCGASPRNPYGRAELHGVDVRRSPPSANVVHRVANLVVEPIPYDERYFQSVSAYDFIEHVPRVWPTRDGTGSRFPFIELMNEIWRVLVPGGRFYALTPAFPHAPAFTDPTHVNVITDATHEYFCGERPLGRMYGFHGHFALLRCEWVDVAEAYSAIDGSPENRAKPRGLRRWAASLRRWSRRLRGSTGRDREVYLLWEFEARKP